MTEDQKPVTQPSLRREGRRGRHVVARTHGGLGNQLFQILYARLVAAGREPRLIHDANYPHAFALSTAFADCPKPGIVERAISAIRIPKLLERSGLSSRGAFPLGATTFLDGYFQDTRFYAPFHPAEMRTELERLRRELEIGPDEVRGAELHHIRLGDFFPSEHAQRDYLAERLQVLPEGAFIITNREDLVGEAIESRPIVPRRLSIVPSGAASADETLRLMSGYETIVSNDSTLAFWAACLASRRLQTPSPLLKSLFVQFTGTAVPATPAAK